MTKLIRHRVTSKCRYVGDQFCNCGSGLIRYPLTIHGEFIDWCCNKCQPEKQDKITILLAHQIRKPMKHLT